MLDDAIVILPERSQGSNEGPAYTFSHWACQSKRVPGANINKGRPRKENSCGRAGGRR